MLKDRYLWLSILLTFLICRMYFGDVFAHPDSYLFSSGGDGLQTYYQSIYHVKLDSTAFHQQGLNYPFGESIFFTGGQPLASNVVKWMMPCCDLSDHMVGITNLMMLVGIFFCTIFLYLVLKELGVPPFYAVLFAVGLTFITQQWDRFGGHYSLAWLYAVPGMLYFLIKYYRNPNYKWTFILFGYTLFLVLGHIYYLIFFGVIALSFWLSFVLFNSSRLISIPKSIGHLFIQVVLPFVILQLLVHCSTDVIDRTKIPWGFIVYRSSLSSYLFPYYMWYEHFFNSWKPKSGVEWEGMAYLGGTALILLAVCASYAIFRFKKLFHSIVKFDNRVFIALAIAGVICVAASFAFPFNFGFEKLLNKLGPLQQFRGIGRFAFVAFYLINVLVISLFWKIPFRSNFLKSLFTILLLILMGSEGKTRVQRASEGIHNARGTLLASEPSETSKMIHASAYQAMLPFPFFHIGSENVVTDCDPAFKNYIYDLSIKTGLPTFAASMSRTSLTQAFSNIALSQELLEVPQVLNELPNQLPLLIVCDTNLALPHQKDMLNHAKSVFNDRHYELYEITPEEIRDYFEFSKQEKLQLDTSKYTMQSEGVWLTNKQEDVLIMDETYLQKFDFDWKRCKEEVIPASWKGKNVVVSFWVKNFKQDLLPRTSLEIIQKCGENNCGYFVEYIGKRFVAMQNGNALIECVIPVDPAAEKMLISFQNKLLIGYEMTCDQFMIRPESADCLILRNENQRWNNRIYQ
jgi:hypothetical protein